MARRTLLLEVGVGALPATTAALPRGGTWAPAMYTPPPPAVPGGLFASPIVDACVMSWTPTPGCETIVETAPYESGVPGTWTLRTVTANAYETIPIPVGQLRFVRVRAIRYGRRSDYSDPVIAAPMVTVFGAGRNLVANGSFEDNSVALPEIELRSGLLCNLWRVLQGTAAASYVKRSSTGAILAQYALTHRLDGQTIANGATLYGDASEYVPSLDLLPGQMVRTRLRMAVTGTADLQGCVLTCACMLVFYNAAGAVIGSIVASTSSQSFSGTLTAVGTVPAGAVRKTIINQLWVTNGTGSAKTLAANVATMVVDGIEAIHVANADEDIGDGIVHGRLAVADTVVVAGERRLGLAIGESGQRVGDYRNLPTSLTASATSYWDGLSVTYTASSTGSATIDVSGATVRRGSVSVSYSAATLTLTGLAVGNHLVYLYYLDAASAGGARTLNYTTDPINLVNADDVQVIAPLTITIPGSGSGSGGGTIGDGGGLRPIPPGGEVP